MRVGIVTTWFERGAAHVSRQYRDILAPEHDVRIFARGGERQARGDPAWDDGRVTWARSVPTHGNTAFDLSQFRRWIERSGLELVLFNEQHWWPPILLCQDVGVRTAAYVDYYTEATVPLFGNYDILICNTQRHHSVFAWHPACHYVPWGTWTDVFLPRRVGPARQGVVTFFHSAGLNPHRKGTDLLLGAFAQLDAPARLIVHAQTELAPRLPDQRGLIAELRRTGRLELHEREVPAPGLYHLGDVYVYPTRLDGIGLTIAEALASGLPVVVPDGPPMNEFLAAGAGRAVAIQRFQPRADGYYWPQCLVDADDLRRQMAWYCENRARLEELRRAARRFAERNLDWRQNARGLGELLASARPLDETLRQRARSAALAFERGRVDLRLFYPRLSRVLLKAAGFVRPLVSRYSGRG
jgi:glycosyltransferase involved in cell wall biosynthesis